MWKPVYSKWGVLIPLATQGKCYTVRVSIVPVLLPALFSWAALAERGARRGPRRTRQSNEDHRARHLYL